MHVLLVEPDRVLGQTYSQALKNAGHKITWKRSAQTALDSLDDQIPDLIVLELSLGVHNGVELLYEIRSYHEWQKVPVIVHTLNHYSKSDLFEPALKRLGIIEVLYKPNTSLKQLIRAVEKASRETN